MEHRDQNRQKTAHGNLLGYFSQFVSDVADAVFSGLGLGWKVHDPKPGSVLSEVITIEVSNASRPPEFSGPHTNFQLVITVKEPGSIEAFLGAGGKHSMAHKDFPVTTSAAALGSWGSDLILKELSFHKGMEGRQAAVDPLAQRVAARYLGADETHEALTMPREVHLPPHVRAVPAHVPEGTDLAVWTWDEEKDTPLKGKRMVYYGIAFAGKSNKPLWYYSFATPEKRQHQIDETVASRKSVIDYKQRKLQERRDFVHNIQKGEVFVSTWGYDQTNVDFYEVVEIKGKMVVVREIASKDHHSEPHADYVVAVPGHFTGPAMMVKPGPNGFKVGDHYASKWDGKPEYSTPAGMGH